MRAALAVIVLAACSGAPEPAPDAPDALPPFPATLEIQPSDGMVTDTFAFGASGSAATPFGAIAIAGNVGTVAVGAQPLSAFVYASATEAPYALYDGFAIDGASWHAFYLYCDPQLVDLYDELVAGDGAAGMVAVDASGTCDAAPTATSAHVSLPAFHATSPTPAPGFTVTGPTIDILSDGNGELALGGTALALRVFDVVDCHDCGGAGWYELHSVVWDGLNQRAIFVIVYLLVGNTSQIELAYARSLPDLADPIGTMMVPATWSTPTSRRVPRGVPPPIGLGPRE
ncbi:MAG TPA: hypothetical protein VGF94_06755 [Kofleriaceae bacterium]|jgi:hypothetical protein